MKLPIDWATLKTGVSDVVDEHGLSNALRDLANRGVHAWVLTKTTTSATPASAWYDDLPANCVGDFTFTAVARTVDGASVAGYRRRAVVQRNGAGDVAFVGAVDTIGVDKETVAGWDATFTVDAGNPTKLYVTVTGDAALTVYWRIQIEGVVAPWQ